MVAAFTAACVGVFGLTKAADIHTVNHATDKDVTTAVHKELQKMFLADIPRSSQTLRSGFAPTHSPERINYPQDVLALRCYGHGSIGVSKVLMDDTEKKHADIPCGGTALTLIANNVDVRAILVTPKGADTWASWAVTRPSPPASDV
ncbi:hypothetical protein ABTZ78_25660 [Streptomyces bauhiniae]|uniref:hypothetical protein n=1 Tax=Streptomyces bauhiniae TaxID=2340725 RepID=UPI00331EE192